MKYLSVIKLVLKEKIGIDKTIGYTLIAKTIQAIGSIVSLSLIALFLTKEEQGFYYTFGSILAIQIFFELGLNSIISQYSAHESAHIILYEPSTNESEKIAQSRLSSLLRFCVKWFVIISIGLFVILLLVGYKFFGEFGNTLSVHWEIPWVFLSIFTCLSFIISPIFSFLEGIGRIQDIAKLRLVQQSVNLIILWILLVLGGKLYSAPIAGIFSLLVVLFILIFSNFRHTLIKIWFLIDKWKVDYRGEILPFQWKLALSWISGYFIFQLFNPVIFATSGAIIAGQMGMTLAILSAIQSLSMSWITTKTPLFSKLIALKNFVFLDDVFNRTLKQSIIIISIGSLSFIICIFLIRYLKVQILGFNLEERFLEPLPIFLMIVALIINQFVFSWANYLRCHKKEPYLLMSVVTAILCALSTIIMGNFFGVIGITLGYLAITSVTFFWAYHIFIIKKNEWH